MDVSKITRYLTFSKAHPTKTATPENSAINFDVRRETPEVPRPPLVRLQKVSKIRTIFLLMEGGQKWVYQKYAKNCLKTIVILT